MIYEVHKILEFHDLYPEIGYVDVRAVLMKYSRETVVRCCHVLSNNYGEVGYIPDPYHTFFSEASRGHIPDLNRRLYKYLTESRQKRVCYFTLKTVLELMRTAFSIPADDYLCDGTEFDVEFDMFRVLLYLNEQLMAFSHEKDIDLATLIFSNRFVQNDIVNQEQADVFVRQVTHYMKLAEFLTTRPECEKALSLFYEKMGISSLEQYARTWGALVALSMKYQKSGEKACPVFNYHKIKDVDELISESVLDALSIGLNDTVAYDAEDTEVREDNVDYRTFRSHPLVKVGDGKYLIYSLPLLLERLYSSMFFDVKDGFKNAFGFYNKEFVERRLFQPTAWDALSKDATMHIPSMQEIEVETAPTEQDGQPDFYVRENDNIILFECKAIRLKGQIKDLADVTDLIDALKQKLYQSTENTDAKRGKKKKPEDLGVKQLVNQMKSIDADTFKLDVDIPDYVAYYPVLVLEDPHLVIPGLSAIINKWYRELINTELSDQMCHPVIVMSINTLIMHKSHFKKCGFHRIFDDYLKTAAKYDEDGIHWTFNPLADFDSFMAVQYRIPKAERIKMHKESLKAFGISSDDRMQA